MRVKLLIIVLGAFAVLNSCQSGKKKSVSDDTIIAVQDTERVITEGIRFCESTYPYQGGLLIANFGTEQLNPLNSEGKGFILFHKDSITTLLIATDGNLSAPKGMFEQDGYLFICDVNKIVVYNLNAPSVVPQIIRLPEGELFVNDLAASGHTLFASVTNTGSIYSLNISDKSNMEKVKPQLWHKVTGANGIIINGNSMYVASYPADGNTTAENVIYYIADINAPKAEPFISEAGQYDGIALSADKKTLYVTNWNPAGVYAIDMMTQQISPLGMKTKVVGAADMTFVDGKLYIPDLPNSQVIEFPLVTE